MVLKVEAANNDAELKGSIVFFCLSHQSKEVGVQLQEDLMKVLNELYTVRNNTVRSGSALSSSQKL